MKFITVIILAVLAVAFAADDIPKLSAEQKAKLEGIAKECLNETDANREIVGAMMAGDYGKVGLKEKCFSRCAQEKFGFIDNDEIKEDAIEKALGSMVGEERIKAVQAKCNAPKGADECDTAFQRHKCYLGEGVGLVKV